MRRATEIRRRFGSEVPDTDAESEGRFVFEMPDTDAMSDDGYEDEGRDEEGNGARLDVEMDEINIPIPRFESRVPAN